MYGAPRSVRYTYAVSQQKKKEESLILCAQRQLESKQHCSAKLISENAWIDRHWDSERELERERERERRRRICEYVCHVVENWVSDARSLTAAAERQQRFRVSAFLSLKKGKEEERRREEKRMERKRGRL